MRPVRVSALMVVFAVMLVTGSTFAQAPTRGKGSGLPVYQWLSEPDREEIPVKVKIIGPALTFEQRHQVRVLVRVNAGALQKTSVRRELHYVMKVADEGGHWFDQENYGNTSLVAKMTGRKELELASDAYFQPGEYTIAIIVHDAVQNQHTVLRRRIRVPVIKDDPLPQLGEGLPPAEFLADPVMGIAALGKPGADLPLRTAHPVHIDLIVDFGAYREYLRSRGARFYASRLLQTSQVLSRLRPTNGCLEVSAVDILRTETFFRRKQAGELHWWEIREQILGRNLDVIEANALAARLKTASLFSKFLADLLTEPASCGSSEEHLDRVVFIVASGVAFPPKTEVEAL